MGLRRKFKKYVVDNYDLKEKPISRKLNHSIRVMKISKRLSRNLNFSKENMKIAQTVGLLHDYARFEQWTKYKTFNDFESVDHGDLAVEKLFDNNEINDYYLDKENYFIVKNAIKYHNKLDVPEELDEHIKIHCELIRDADKLDIWYILASNINKITEDDEAISKKVEEDFYDNKLVKKIDVNNQSDNLLVTLSMVFDLNFNSSLLYLNSKNYIWKIYETLDNKEKYKKYFEYVDNYIKERIK